MLAKQLSGSVSALPPEYVEDVFSTYLYTGNGSTQTITNGIDLAGEGGLVWIKSRTEGGTNYTGYPTFFDTGRGAGQGLFSSSTVGQSAYTTALTAFNSSGFSLGDRNFSNYSGDKFVSWTFRKAPKFFDVVTYTGNGANRTISHNLGSVPGCIIVKRTDTTSDWQVYHRSLANTEYVVLNSTAAKATGTTRWNSTTPTSTEFTVGTAASVNTNGGTYVAYLFAHDAGGFGLTGTDNVISCGSFTTDGVGNDAVVNLGFDPQWLLIKPSSTTQDWLLADVMRGMPASGKRPNRLTPNLASAESVDGGVELLPTATGFTYNGITSTTHIYIAIRRGPMKVPTSGTEVYNAITRTGTGAAATVTGVGFPPDLFLGTSRAGSINHRVIDRLRGAGNELYTPLTNAELNDNTGLTAFGMDGFSLGNSVAINGSGTSHVYWNFRRAPGFFDVVCDTGTGSAHTITHNLGAVPELMIRKKRSAADNWIVYANNDNTDYLILNSTAATADDNTMWNDTSPTSSVFTVGTNDDVNGSGATFVTYLFATVSGVSKVGSYTGTGTTKQIDCGFTGGARFVLIKRTDSTGDWYVWDTARGIVAGNDSYLLLNSTAAEVTNTDYIDTYSAGFEISSTAPAAINANGGSFIFLAIA